MEVSLLQMFSFSWSLYFLSSQKNTCYIIIVINKVFVVVSKLNVKWHECQSSGW